jgi:hypothetical protein
MTWSERLLLYSVAMYTAVHSLIDIVSAFQ